MLNWEQTADGRFAVAETRLAYLKAESDEDKPGAYVARVVARDGRVARTRRGGKGIAEAKAWCEAEYRALLQAEIAALG